MSNFIPKAFLELERLMHPVTVDRMKDSFIQRIKAKYAQQEDFPETIDNVHDGTEGTEILGIYKMN